MPIASERIRHDVLNVYGAATTACLGEGPLRGELIELYNNGGELIAADHSDVLGKFALKVVREFDSAPEPLFIRVRGFEVPMGGKAGEPVGAGTFRVQVTAPCSGALSNKTRLQAPLHDGPERAPLVELQGQTAPATKAEPATDRPVRLRLKPGD